MPGYRLFVVGTPPNQFLANGMAAALSSAAADWSRVAAITFLESWAGLAPTTTSDHHPSLASCVQCANHEVGGRLFEKKKLAALLRNQLLYSVHICAKTGTNSLDSHVLMWSVWPGM